MRAIGTQEFINNSKQVHGDRYDYSKVNYVNNKTKVGIICPVHGEFQQTPGNHLNATTACLKCAQEQIGFNKRVSVEHFLSKAVKVHGGRYLYDKVYFKTTRDPIVITCRAHGDFKQTVGNHLKGDHCPHCAKIGSIRKKRYTQEEFITLANHVHNNKYDYSHVHYKGVKESIKIICPMHGEFTQKPNSHLSGYACNKCSKYGFDKQSPAILYYLKIVTSGGQVLYKIGITNRTLNERFNLTDLSMITVIDTKQLETGLEAYQLEQGILNKYKEHLYKGESILSSGNTELFNKNVLPEGLTDVK